METRPLRIVCFGDSLTVGYQSPTRSSPLVRETPYGQFLQDRLGPGVEIVVRGVCGELTADMIRRFPRDVLTLAPAFVVILGGTNDLGWHRQPQDVAADLTTMYQAARAAGVRPVAVTVPSIRLADVHGGGAAGEVLQHHVQRRLLLNRLIVETSGALKMPCVDLFGATAEPQTLELAAQYSNDGLHLTTEGYRRLADLLYEQVFDLGEAGLR